MDIQLIVVVLCIAAAAVYFGRRMYWAVRKGQCAGCDSGCADKKSGCACGCSGDSANAKQQEAQRVEAQRLESRRINFQPKDK